jgi:hypothetical protein
MLQMPEKSGFHWSSLFIVGHEFSPDSKKVNMLSGDVMNSAMGDEKMRSIKGV